MLFGIFRPKNWGKFFHFFRAAAVENCRHKTQLIYVRPMATRKCSLQNNQTEAEEAALPLQVFQRPRDPGGSPVAPSAAIFSFLALALAFGDSDSDVDRGSGVATQRSRRLVA